MGDSTKDSDDNSEVAVTKKSGEEGDNNNNTNNNDNKNDNNEDEFIMTQLSSNIYMFRERYYTNSFNVANLYLIKGYDMDLIIDTGLGIWDFCQYLKDNDYINESKKPYQAIVTHVHFDHAGGLYQFNNKFCIHELEVNAIVNGDCYESVCFVTESDIGKKPKPTSTTAAARSTTWHAKNYTLQKATPQRIVQDNDIIDLGGNNEQYHILHLPGHSRGSIALLNKSSGILFSGDIIYEGTLLDFLPYSNIQHYIKSFERLLTFIPQIQHVYPGHYNHFNGIQLQEYIKEYLDQAGTCHECTSIIPKTIFTLILKGRNAASHNNNNIEEACPNCCFFTCCCGPTFCDHVGSKFLESF